MIAANFVLRLESGDWREMVFYSTETQPAAEQSRENLAGNFNTFYYSKLCNTKASIIAGGRK